MSVLKRREPVDPAAIYTCLMGHISRAGTFREGDQVRGDHEAVKQAPLFWYVGPLPEDEIRVLRTQRGLQS